MQKTTYRQLAIEFKRTKSHEVFSKLYEKIKPRMKSFVLGIVKDSEAAEDIVADAMSTVFMKIDQYNPDYQITTWSYTIAYNIAIQYIRDRNKKVSLTPFQETGIEVSGEGSLLQQEKMQDLQMLENDFESIEASLLEEERLLEEKHKACVNAIQDLKPLYKDIMIDRFINKLSYIQIEEREKGRINEKIKDLEEKLQASNEKEKPRIVAALNSCKRKNINGQTIKNRIHTGRKLVQDTLKQMEIFQETTEEI